MGRMKTDIGILAVLGCLVFTIPYAYSSQVMNMTTGQTAIHRSQKDLSPMVQNRTWATILWDTHHGIYIGYSPSGRYSNLTAILEAKGYSVEENSAGVLTLDLSKYAMIVICLGSAWDSPYSSEEVTAITTFVANGGSLLIMGDNSGCPNANINPVSVSFGTSLAVSGVSNDYISHFSDHSIFEGVSQIYMISTSGISGVSPSSEEAWADNGIAVVTTAQSGKGYVIVLSDINSMEDEFLTISDNEPFSKNVFDWLLLKAMPLVYISQDGVCNGNEPCFSSIQGGINASEQISFLHITAENYDEDLRMDQPKELVFQGGWDSTFTTQSSFTTVKSITVSSGSLTAEYLIIR